MEGERHPQFFSYLNARSNPQKISSGGTSYFAQILIQSKINKKFCYFELTKGVCLFIKLIWVRDSYQNMKSVRFHELSPQ